MSRGSQECICCHSLTKANCGRCLPDLRFGKSFFLVKDKLQIPPYNKTEILAIDNACVDILFSLPDKDNRAILERMLSRHGLRQLSYMKELGMGNDRYVLIDIDNDDVRIDAAKAAEAAVKFKGSNQYD